MSKNSQTDRHPIRTLVRVLILFGLAGMAAKVVAAKKKEFFGLTESQAREKFAEKLGPKLGDDKATELADQVIPRLKERGIVRDDPVSGDVNAEDDLKAGGGSDTDSDE